MTDRPRLNRRKRRAYKIIRLVKYIGVFVLTISLMFIIIWQVLVLMGKQSLYKRSEQMNRELMNQLSDENVRVADVGWEEGWIRRGDKIYQYNEDILTFLVLGIDKNDEVMEGANSMDGGQADANFLVVINPKEETIKLVCINRDTMTLIDAYDLYGNHDTTTLAQICLAHAYGNSNEENAQNSVKAVSRLFYGIPIHGYCAINMAAIPVINDSVGGVTLTSLETFSVKGYSFVKNQKVSLHGMGAFWYVKHRNTKEFNSNGNRLLRQKQYLNAFVSEAKSTLSKKPAYAATLYNSILPYMTTNVSVDEVTYLASTVLNYNFNVDDLINLKGETVQGEYYEEFYPDDAALKELVLELFYEEVNT